MTDEQGAKQPVEVGDEIELKCISIGKKGDGIFKYEGFVVIVPGVEVDNVYRLKINKVFKSVAFATLVGDDDDTQEDSEEFKSQEEEDT